MNNPSSVFHSSQRGIVRGLFLWHTFCLLMQKMPSGPLARGWLWSTSPANASHLLATAIIPFNTIARLQTDCGLTDKETETEKDGCVHVCQKKDFNLDVKLNVAAAAASGDHLARWRGDKQRRRHKKKQWVWIKETDNNPLDSQRLHVCLQGLMGKHN